MSSRSPAADYSAEDHVQLSTRTRAPAMTDSIESGGLPLPGQSRSEGRRERWAYWTLALLLTGFVGLLTAQRENNWGADAWEHHRAIVALARDMVHPGNPTLATSDPSIRYSPYSIALALLVRSTGFDAYSVLGLAAVVNTFLLVSGLYALAKSFGEERSAPSILVVMVTLYGQLPQYAGSLALADLPWHQVNPSALSIALLLWSLWALKGLAERRLAVVWVVFIVLATSLTLLSHGMSSVMYVVAFLALALCLPVDARRRALAYSLGSCCIALGLALLWPWYDFWFAVTEKPDNEYWFNPNILRTLLLCWCAPLLLAAIPSVALIERRMVRFGLVAGAACYCCSLASVITQSPTLARQALPGMIFLQLAVGVYAKSVGLFEARTWVERFRRLSSRSLPTTSAASMELVLAVAILYFGWPQVWSILREPYLARSWVAPLVGAEHKQLDLRARLDSLLASVSDGDVVLSDALTSWPVPSLTGRVVVALHREFFVPNQLERESDVLAFFSRSSEVDRRGLLAKYDVRWILLCKQHIDPVMFDRLLIPSAVAAQDDMFVLMDAERWARASSG
jgi:hypothetical protein